MAAVVLGISTTSTANNQTSYACGSFTPVVGDLLVVFVVLSAAVATDGSVSVASASPEALSFTRIESALKAASADKAFWFVGNQLVGTAGARILTFDCGDDDTATGCIITVLRVSGMTNVGTAAVRQSGKQENTAAGNTPTAVFAGNALTTNPLVGMVANGSNPAAISPPDNPLLFAELSDNGYATPATGMETCSLDSGFTQAGFGWGGTSGSNYCCIGAELDAAGAASGQPTMKRYGGIPNMGGRGGEAGGGFWGRST